MPPWLQYRASNKQKRKQKTKGVSTAMFLGLKTGMKEPHRGKCSPETRDGIQLTLNSLLWRKHQEVPT